MRIAIVIHEFPPYGGGAATAAAQIAAELVRAGHVVRVITSQGPGTSRHVPKSAMDQSGFEVVRLAAGRRSRVAPRSHELLSYMAHCWWSLERLLREFHADGVIAFMAIPSGYFAVQAAHRLAIPAVVSLRGSDVPGFSPERVGSLFRGMAERLVRWTLRQADAVAPNSRQLAFLAEEFAPELRGRMTIVPNGIEPAAIANQPASSDGSCLRLVQVGQLIPRKQVHLTIEAVPRLVAQGLRVRLCLMGDGPLRVELQELASRVCPAGTVEFWGPLGRADILQRLPGYDLFLNTSKTEGMSNAVLEAMAAGLPVVITQNGSDEIVQQAACGRVLRDSSVAAIVEEVAALYHQPAQRRAMGGCGIAFARTHSWSQSAAGFVQLIETAQQNRSGRRGVDDRLEDLDGN